MRLRSLLAGIAFVWVSAAEAGTLTMVTWTQPVGPFEVGVPLTAIGSARTYGVSAFPFQGCGCVSLDVPAFQSTNFMPKTGNGVLDIAYILTIAGKQHLTATQGHAHATQGIPGTILVKTAMHSMGSMFEVGGITLLHIPLSVGKGGTEMGTFSVLGVPHSFTVHQFGWTPGAAQFTGLTTKGMALPDASAAGSFHPPFDGQPGSITLVAPTRIDIHGDLAQRSTVSFTTLKMAFAWEEGATRPICVPEPGEALLLLGGFAAWLSALRRRAA